MKPPRPRVFLGKDERELVFGPNGKFIRRFSWILPTFLVVLLIMIWLSSL